MLSVMPKHTNFFTLQHVPSKEIKLYYQNFISASLVRSVNRKKKTVIQGFGDIQTTLIVTGQNV